MHLSDAIALAVAQLKAEREIAVGCYFAPGASRDDLSSLDDTEREHLAGLNAAISALETAWPVAVEKISAGAHAIASLAESRLEDMHADAESRHEKQIFRCTNYVAAIDRVREFRAGLEHVMPDPPLWDYDVRDSLRHHAEEHGVDLEAAMTAHSDTGECPCCANPSK
ncbi:hypothetical protein EOD42_14360 [Rhodovarius crocodyli]|uniref:Uncharacterized protein n=1 Tax=Rhodovarius crocodyli TaxID=1979269 RepID=A0A437MF84_9PROT|nr:hypothetical protein [Rhodovarius crocodyli]RVT96290.1 hypothetical protein EOD42_14360 [Rhodovarius crocodyli]